MVIWLCGLSGVGKTTIAQALHHRLKPLDPKTILVDGDSIRQLFSHENSNTDYSLVARRNSAERIQNLCKWLDSESLTVICSSIAMFEDINKANRDLFSSYLEVHVDVPLATLIERDNKGLYQSAIRGETQNVVGIDIPYNSPNTPDLVINNSYDTEDIPKYVDTIIQTMKNMNDALPLHR